MLRALGGNLQALSRLIEPEMPIFEMVGNTIPVLQLPQVDVPNAAEQETSMLGLMTATHDRLDVIEALLAALIQGVQIVVKNAPSDLDLRIGFIEGLLALLPPPARFGVTFATHALPSTRINAQIRFFSDDPVPTDALVYLWDEAKVAGVQVEDEYARYIRSQLRLDTGLVVEQTTALTAVAAWRIRLGDTLSEALNYASYRLKIDTAIQNNQPIEAGETAKVLAEDPTLTDTLRAAYVRHLLAFALVLDEIEHADKLAVVVRGQPDLERVILQQMSEALAAGKADRVYRTLARWLSNPLGFNGMYWVELTQQAALGLRRAVGEDQADRHARRLLGAHAPQQRQYRNRADHPAPDRDRAAAGGRESARWRRVFLCWRRGRCRRIAGSVSSASSRCWRSLPPILSQFVAVLGGKDAAAPDLLVKVAGMLGDEWRSLLVIRLVEVALLTGRHDLIERLGDCGAGAGSTVAVGQVQRSAAVAGSGAASRKTKRCCGGRAPPRAACCKSC